MTKALSALPAREANPARVLQICLLGPLEPWRAGQLLSPSLSRKTRALLGYLAATDRDHTRAALAALFCAETDDPLAVLRWHLSRMRRALGDDILFVDGELVRLNPEAVWVDSHAFERVLGTSDSAIDVPTWETAVGWYRGEFLAGLSLRGAPEFDFWLLGQRAHLHRLYERGLSELVSRLTAAGDYESALAHARKLVESDPFLEAAHARLIWLYGRTGQREAALQQFERARDFLSRELSVAPSEELRALHAQLLAGQTIPTILPRTGRLAAHDLRQEAPFVGRDDEMAPLVAAFQAAWSGRGSVLLVEGGAGLGKSRLVHEFAARVASQTTLLEGRCYESSRTLPYHPWISLLEAYFESVGSGPLGQVAPMWLEPVARLLPLVSTPVGAPERSPTTSGGDLEAFFAAIAHVLLHSFGSPAPRLLFIDDLQWADESSLRLFHFLARRVVSTASGNGVGCLLVGSCRVEEADENLALAALRRDLRRMPTQIVDLPVLGAQSIATLTERLWPSLPGGYRPHVGALLAHATGGNPLFLVEVLRELAHTSDVPVSLPVPDSVRDLIRRRLAQLPESGRQLLQALAILGEPATLVEAQRVSARSEEEAVATLDLGLSWRLLEVETDVRPARYRFAHDLVRAAVGEEVSVVRRHLLHRRAAATLAQQAARLPRAPREVASGRVLQHALAGEAYELVQQWAPLAAARARAVHAYTEALDAYRAAEEAMRHVEQHVPLGQQVAVLLQQAEMLAVLGQWNKEAPVLDRVAAVLERHPDEALMARFYLRRAQYHHDVCDYGAAIDDAQAALAVAQARGESLEAAESLYVWGRALMSLGRNREAQRHLTDARALLRAVDSPSHESQCLSALAYCHLELGEIEAARSYVSRVLELADERADPLGRAHACLVMALTWNACYAVEPVRHFATEALRLAEALGSVTLPARCWHVLGNCYFIEGALDHARALYEQALDAAFTTQDGWLEGWLCNLLGRLALMRGDRDEAERLLERARQLRHARGERQNIIADLTWLARLYLAQHRPTVALDHTRQAVTRLEALRVDAYVWDSPDVYLCHAEALAATGDYDTARSAIQEAYTRLMAFAGSLHDPAVRSQFLAFNLHRRILDAWETGKITSLVD